MTSARAPLRTGWTTGSCATAATAAAFEALVSGVFPDPVTITLPGGADVAFALALHERDQDRATVGVVKDAGDDPDVTHGALIVATLRLLPAADGVRFKAGSGVGTVTLGGLALAIGEPAINPVPRQMMRDAIARVAARLGLQTLPGVEITLSIPDGETIATRTLNGRLGIVGGLSILGTTGIVRPYSCAAWIHGIHDGIDVARANGLAHVAGGTGRTSEKAVLLHHGLADMALIDMGDFVGGMLKYLRTRPVARVTVAGGVAKMTKLAQGMLDVHSKRGEVDLALLATLAETAGGSAALGDAIRACNTGAQAFDLAEAEGIGLGDAVAAAAWRTAAQVVDNGVVSLDVLLFDRIGRLRGSTTAQPAQLSEIPRNRR